MMEAIAGLGMLILAGISIGVSLAVGAGIVLMALKWLEVKDLI